MSIIQKLNTGNEMKLNESLSVDEVKAYLYHNKFVVPSAQSYQSAATQNVQSKGYQTYGYYGLQIKNKIVEIWRSIFIDNENVFEIETPNIVSRVVLENSGHVKRFNDYVTYDLDDPEKTKFRADHLVKDFLSDI